MNEDKVKKDTVQTKKGTSKTDILTEEAIKFATNTLKNSKARIKPKKKVKSISELSFDEFSTDEDSSSAPSTPTIKTNFDFDNDNCHDEKIQLIEYVEANDLKKSQLVNNSDIKNKEEEKEIELEEIEEKRPRKTLSKRTASFNKNKHNNVNNNYKDPGATKKKELTYRSLSSSSSSDSLFSEGDETIAIKMLESLQNKRIFDVNDEDSILKAYTKLQYLPVIKKRKTKRYTLIQSIAHLMEDYMELKKLVAIQQKKMSEHDVFINTKIENEDKESDCCCCCFSF